MKKLLASLEFRLSDLFLAIGFIPMVVFLIFGQEFMQYQNPDVVALKLPLIIPLFLILITSWGIYLYIEFKRQEVNVNRYIIMTFILLAIIGVIGILTQPQNFEINMIKMDGDAALINIFISPTHYVFFSFDIISILLFIFIGIFVFPKRFKSTKIIAYAGYFVFLLCIVLIICSYILESGNYIHFIEALLDGDFGLANWYASKSIIVHKNAYGISLLLGIIFCCINHSMNRKWWYFPLAIFFFINMIFTLCRTSLILSPIILIIYSYHFILTGIKTKKSYLVALIILTSIIGIFVLSFGISYLTKGEFLKPLYNIVKAIGNSYTMDSREWIWINTYQLISHNLPLTLLIGRGFGTMNEMLFPMNLANGDTPLSFPTHNGFLNLFAEGGLPYLFAYISLLGYASTIVIKCYKNNKKATIAVALGLFSFVFYSLIETIHYLSYVFMFVLFVFYNTQSAKEIKE